MHENKRPAALINKANFWVAWSSLAIFLISIDTIYSFSPSTGIFVNLFAKIFLLVILFVVLLVAIVKATTKAYHHLYRVMSLSLITAVFYFLPISIGDYIHLLVKYPEYRDEIIKNNKPIHIAFDWGGTGFLQVGNSTRSLIYDSTNSLSSKLGVQEGDSLWIRTRHLYGGFYTVEERW